jgi:uncharacterized membrane protein (DUF106 family)
MKNAALWLKLTGIALVLVVIVSVVQAYREVSKTTIDYKKVRLTKKQYKTVAEAVAVLKEDEILIIQELKNEKQKIIILPADSLQYYADSLYSGM